MNHIERKRKRMRLVRAVAVAFFTLAAAQALTAQSLVIDSIFPQVGPASTVVTVRGSGFGSFVSVQDNQVLFGGVPGIVSQASDWHDSEIRIVVPLSAISGPVEVRVGGDTSNPGPVFMVVTPEITGLSVTRGPVSTVTQILGRNFGNGVDTGSGRLAGAGRALHVLFNGTPGLVAGQFCCNLSGWTDTEIEVQTPLSATTGPVQVRIQAVDVDLEAGVTVPGFVTSAPGPDFEVVVPEITGLSVSRGPASTVTRILGRNFGNGVDTGSGRLASSCLACA